MRMMSLSRLLAALRCWRRVQREREQLLAMSDAELRDIRLSRVDVAAAIRQPALQPCLRAEPPAPARS